MNNQVFNLLGLCRKAGKLSMGHDACKPSIKNGRAVICIICQDASDRLKGEISEMAEEHNVRIINTGYKMADIKQSIGVRSAVMTVDDEGFAKAILKKLNENKSGEERDL